MAQTAGQVAPSRVTPETLRPEPGPPPAISLPNGAPAQIPPEAANLSITVGQFEVSGTFPQFQNQTAVLINALRGTRMTVAQIYALAAGILSMTNPTQQVDLPSCGLAVVEPLRSGPVVKE